MTIAASIIFILLATYWFGFKEGFFSGLIHLACVIVAGAVAFAFWEPLAVAMLGSSSTREWAWGVSLLAIFCFALFLLRLAGNLLIPDKLNFPHIVDIVGGGATGAAAGLLTAGAWTATTLWVLASLGFSWFVRSFGHYNETYGSVGAVIVLMLWLYLTAFVLLLGAEVDAELSGTRSGDRQAT